MTPQREALNIVLDLLKKEKNFKVMPSALPKAGGISAEITGSEVRSRSLNLQHGIANLTVLFLCKDKDHITACDTLYEIGNYLDRLGEVRGETVQITAASIGSGAGLVGKEGDFYIYSMIAKIGIYF